MQLPLQNPSSIIREMKRQNPKIGNCFFVMTFDYPFMPSNIVTVFGGPIHSDVKDFYRLIPVPACAGRGTTSLIVGRSFSIPTNSYTRHHFS
jgi:hypothetical protein